MNFDPVHERLRRVERKVEYQTWILYLQSGLLSVLLVLQFLRLSGYMLVLLAICLPLLIIFRRSLPGWIRRWGQFSDPGSNPNGVREPPL
jgi:hypothetical protein